MTTRRRWLLLAAAFALALLFAWRRWPPAAARRDDAIGAQHAQPAPPASARRAPPIAGSGRRPTAPAPSASRTGIAACDNYVQRTMNCPQLPHDAKIAVAEASKAWAKLTAAGPHPDLEASCRATASVQAASLAAMGC